MNGDAVTVDRCDKLRAQGELENERRVQDMINKFACEIKADIKELQTAMINGQKEVLRKVDAKYDKLLYVILGWIITTALLLYSKM